MKKVFVFWVLLLLSYQVFNSQTNREIDSLKTLVNQSKKEDTTKVDLLIKLAFKYATVDTLKCNYYSNAAYLLAQKLGDSKSLGNCMNNFGRNYYFRGQFKLCESYFNKAVVYFEKAKYYKGLGSVYNNLGAIANSQGDSKKAIEYQEKSLIINQKINNQEAIANNYTNIGNCYNTIGEYKKAMEYFLKSEKIYDSLKLWPSLSVVYQNLCKVYYQIKLFQKALDYANKNMAIQEKQVQSTGGIATAHILLAAIYFEWKNYPKAKHHYKEALKFGTEIGDPFSLAYAYMNYSKIFSVEKQTDTALVMITKAVDIAQSINAKELLAECYLVSGQLRLDTKDTKNAFKDFEKGYNIAIDINNRSSICNLSYGLSQAQFELGEYKDAYTNLMRYTGLRDTILSDETVRLTTDLETKYQSEKKDLQIKKQKTDIKLKESESKRKTVVIWLSLLALLCSAFFGLIAYINYRKTKRANIIIENQKQEVELKNEEITHQKEIVEEKQKEIIDSINYAKRIQTAVLIGKDVWEKVSKEHFILFKPKDIVSGDFYWAYNTPNNRSIFVLADCTGHGVPGGFMSMLGNSFLNEIVVENKIFKANEILNKLRAKIIAALDQEGKSEQKDGMDISLCVWNKLDNTLEFSGAHNPIWILSNGELNEIKADKMPIGSYIDEVTSFNSTVIQLQAGDVIYMSTDGYADQFGGPKGKKLKYKAMLELMIANSKEPMVKQKEILETYFENWKHGYEQVDDVSVIGVRV